MTRLLLSPSPVRRSMYTSVRRLVTKRDEDGIEGRIGPVVATAVDPMSNSTDQQRLGENLEPASDTARPWVSFATGGAVTHLNVRGHTAPQ